MNSRKLGLDQIMKQRGLCNKCTGERREMKHSVHPCTPLSLYNTGAATPPCKSQCGDINALIYAQIPQGMYPLCTVTNAANAEALCTDTFALHIELYS